MRSLLSAHQHVLHRSSLQQVETPGQVPFLGKVFPSPLFGKRGEDEGAGSCGGSRGLPECRRLAAGRSACPGLHRINISLNAAPSSRPDRGDLWGCSRAARPRLAL